MAIKAPFNFVPLADKVFFPEWAAQISQDIPFKDGVSGTINLKITAESPIFVRNGHTSKDKEENNDAYKSFSKTPDGKYFIPATSIKGAIRNVLEIMSFGKMTQVQNQSFGIRDLSTGSDGRFYREKIKPENIHCGWLKMEDEDHYLLEDCGLPWRISAEALDGKFGVGLKDFIFYGDFSNDENRTAAAKYDLFKGQNLVQTFSPDEDLRKVLKVGNRQFVKFDSSGEEGVIVFTGQSGNRKKTQKTNKKGEKSMTGKYYEFVFPKVNTKPVEVNKYVIKEFLSIHKNSPDFIKMWRDKLISNERIPVFFMYDKQEISSIGLAYMYKYPAYNSIYQAIPNELKDNERLDLSECIFGTVGTSDLSLKGRVSFSHAMAIGEPTVMKQQSYVLSTPHPSYYPLYIGNGNTWNSDAIRLAGRKRYPVRNHIMKSTIGTGDMQSMFCPLDKGAEFTAKVRFHNLKKVELGALLSALTFHGNNNECYHSLGMAKPYGFGKVRIELIGFKDDDCLKVFEGEMNKFSNNAWNSQIEELFAMAKGIPEDKESDFIYMKMSTDSSKNEFKAGKEEYADGHQLGLFTQILEGNVPLAKYCGNVMANAERKNEEEQQEKLRKKREAYREMIAKAEASVQEKDWYGAEKFLEEAEKYTVSKDDINRLQNIIDAERHKITEQAAALIKEAETLLNQGDPNGAKAKCEEAKAVNPDAASRDLEERITKALKASDETIEDFAERLNIASIGAFEGNCKKRIKAGHPFVMEDVDILASKIKPNIPKAKQKEWANRRSWQNLAKTLGQEIAEALYAKVNG